MSSDRKAPLNEHLREFAKRLKVVFYFLIASTLAILALPGDLDFLNNPLSFYTPLVSIVFKRITHDILPPQFILIGYTIGAPVELYVYASLLLGVAVTMPVMGYEIYQFVNPALYEHERRAAGPFVVSFTALFFTGAIFGYVFLARFTMWAMLPFFVAVGAQPIISVTDFYSLVLSIILMSGLTFTFPVFLVLLVRFGVVSTEIVTKNRRYIYPGIFVAISVMTADGGPIADGALMIPFILLLETAVLIARRYETKGAPTSLKWFGPEASCRFCGAEMTRDERFCRRCRRSQD